MKAINVFLSCTTSMFILNVVVKLVADIEPLSTEATLIIGFAVTWCIFKDRE